MRLVTVSLIFILLLPGLSAVALPASYGGQFAVPNYREWMWDSDGSGVDDRIEARDPWERIGVIIEYERHFKGVAVKNSNKDCQHKKCRETCENN